MVTVNLWGKVSSKAELEVQNYIISISPSTLPVYSPGLLSPSTLPVYSPRLLSPSTLPVYSPRLLSRSTLPVYSPRLLSPSTLPVYSPRLLSPSTSPRPVEWMIIVEDVSHCYILRNEQVLCYLWKCFPNLSAFCLEWWFILHPYTYCI